MTGEVKDFLEVRELNVGSVKDFGSPTKPNLRFGDGDSGFYESSDDEIRIALAGTFRWSWAGVQLHSSNANGPALRDEVASSLNPTLIPNRSDADTGIGWGNAADEISIIAGGVQAANFSEASGDVLQQFQANVGLTADAGSSQGDGVITSSYNVYSTVGTAGDAATLPSAFGMGRIVYIKNDAAVNSMDVFPASGDDAGAGANTAVAVAAGDFAVFMATVDNSTWTKIAGGTA